MSFATSENAKHRDHLNSASLQQAHLKPPLMLPCDKFHDLVICVTFAIASEWFLFLKAFN